MSATSNRIQHNRSQMNFGSTPPFQSTSGGAVWGHHPTSLHHQYSGSGMLHTSHFTNNMV